MEAKLHTKLTEKLNPKLEEYFKENGIDSFEINSLHLGNWISDFSQAIDEGFKALIYKFLIYPKDFAANIQQYISLIKSYISNDHFILDLKEINEKLQILPKSLNTVSLSKIKDVLREKDGSFPIEYNDFKNLGDSLKNELDNLNQYLDEEYVKISSDIKSIEEAEDNKSIQAIENGLFNIVKLVGFVMFKVGETGEIDFENFNNITNKLLTPYRPVHHLDRSVGYDKVKGAKGDTEENIHKYLVDEPQTKRSKKLLQNLEGDDPFQKLLSKIIQDTPDNEDKNIFSKNDDLNNVIQLETKDFIDLYGYLKENMVIACGKLTDFELYFKNLSPIYDPLEFNLKLAELGTALHMFEDFYSHSNFIEFSILSLYQIYKSPQLNQFKNPHQIQALFNGVPQNKLAFTNLEMNKVVRSLVKTAKNPKNIDSNIATGFFGSNDLFISLFHILVGTIKSRISDLDEEKTYTENVIGKIRTDLVLKQKELLFKVQSIQQLEKKISEIEKKKESELKALEKEYFADLNISEDKFKTENKYRKDISQIEEQYDEETEMINDFIKNFNRYTEIRKKIDFSNIDFASEPPEYITDKELAELFVNYKPDNKVALYLKRAINYFILAKDLHHVYKFGKDYLEAFKRIYQIIRIILTLIRIIKILLKYPAALVRLIKLFVKKALGYIPEYLLVKEYILQLVENSMVRALEFIKDPLLKKTEYTTGCHSLMAKDEEYEKPKLNDLAMKMAAYVDLVIFKNMFTYKDKENFVDWYTLIQLYCVNYTNINTDVLPYHQLDMIRDYQRRLNLNDIQHKTWYQENEKKINGILEKNNDPYDGKTPVAIKTVPPLPVRVYNKVNGTNLPFNPGLLNLFNYEIILRGDKDVGNVLLPANLSEAEAKEFLEITKEINKEINKLYLHAAIIQNYLVK